MERYNGNEDDKDTYKKLEKEIELEVEIDDR